LKIIGSQTEDDLVKWANTKVGKLQIKSFKDASLANSVFLINICAAIRPGIVDWDIVMKGETDEE